MVGLFGSATFWTAVGAFITLFSAWLTYFLTKRSARFALQMEAIVRAVVVVTETIDKLGEVEEGILKEPLSYMSYTPTIKVSQSVHEALTNELFLLAARAKDKELYALIWYAQSSVWRAIITGQQSADRDGEEQAAEDIRVYLEDELLELHGRLTRRLAKLPFHKSATRKYENMYFK